MLDLISINGDITASRLPPDRSQLEEVAKPDLIQLRTFVFLRSRTSLSIRMKRGKLSARTACDTCISRSRKTLRVRRRSTRPEPQSGTFQLPFLIHCGVSGGRAEKVARAVHWDLADAAGAHGGGE